jgi:predicted nucleic acid-binding Zn ribbon protein
MKDEGNANLENREVDTLMGSGFYRTYSRMGSTAITQGIL